MVFAPQEATPGLACVVTHRVGDGSIVYFGDVICEAATIQLVASYVLSMAPGQAILGEAAHGAQSQTRSAETQKVLRGIAQAWKDKKGAVMVANTTG